MGEEGFSSDSSLLYHRHIPSAIVDVRRVGAARPEHDAQPPAQAAPPQAARPVPRGRRDRRRRGDRPPAAARQRRRAHLLRGRRRADRRSTATRSATSALRRVRRRRRRDACSARSRSREGDYVLIPRSTTHRWSRRATSRCGSTRSRPTAHIGPPKRYLSRFGQLLEHAPYCERDLRGPSRAAARRGRATSRSASSTAGRARWDRRHGARLPAAPVRRRRLGRLPLPVHVQHLRLRADHRSRAPAAAGAPGVRGPQLRHLQLRAAQGRLPPAGDPGAVLPLQRRLRRDHVLLRRRLRGPQGLRHRRRARSRCTPAATRTARSRARTSAASAPSSSTNSPSWSTRSARSNSARARWPARTPPTRGPGRRDGGTGRRRDGGARPRSPAALRRRRPLPARQRAADRRRARARRHLDERRYADLVGPFVVPAPRLDELRRGCREPAGAARSSCR